MDVKTSPNCKVALITGGARMGTAIGQQLGPRGFEVILAYRHSRREADHTARLLRSQGISSWSLRCDLGKMSSIRKAFATIEKRCGRLDAFINLASVYEETPLLSKTVERDWDENMSANARGGYLASVLASQLMNRGKGGRIVHVSDWTAASGRPRYKEFAPYYVAKGAVKSMVEALALELAPHILVNAIAPGPILPPPLMTAREKKRVELATPLGRWGGSEAVAKAILFLVETDFVTGETIRVDGGRHLL